MRPPETTWAADVLISARCLHLAQAHFTVIGGLQASTVQMVTAAGEIAQPQKVGSGCGERRQCGPALPRLAPPPAIACRYDPTKTVVRVSCDAPNSASRLDNPSVLASNCSFRVVSRGCSWWGPSALRKTSPSSQFALGNPERSHPVAPTSEGVVTRQSLLCLAQKTSVLVSTGAWPEHT